MYKLLSNISLSSIFITVDFTFMKMDFDNLFHFWIVF